MIRPPEAEQGVFFLHFELPLLLLELTTLWPPLDARDACCC